MDARRAAVLSLGIMGSFEHSNTVLGKALSDDDPVVRSMAEDGLWAVWFRADTPEHNEALGQVALAISRDQLDDALVLATRLIARALALPKLTTRGRSSTSCRAGSPKVSRIARRSWPATRFTSAQSPAWPSRRTG